MTLVAVPQLLVPDPGPLITQGGVTYNSLLLDAAAEKAAWIIRAPKTGNLARVGFRTGTVTTGDTMKVSFQDVSGATGDPDGVVDQFRTVAIADVDDNVWIRTSLITSDGTDGGTKRAVTRGDVFAVVVEFNAFVAGNLNVAATLGVIVARGPWLGSPCYADHFTAAWAKVATGAPVLAIEYDDGTFAFIPGTLPFLTVAVGAYASNSTPDEEALKFKLPASVSISGCWLFGGPGGNSGDYDVVLYDSDGTTPLRTVSIDANQVPSVSTGGVMLMFTSSVTLAADTFYRISMKPTTTNTVALYNATHSSAHGVAILDQSSGGQNFHWSQRTDAGAWTDDTLRRPFVGLVIDGIDDGASVGGISRAAVVNTGGL